MLELPKSTRFRVLVLGLILVKLALFLFLYHPVLGLSPQPSIVPQGVAYPLPSQPQALTSASAGEGGPLTPAREDAAPVAAIPMRRVAAPSQQMEGMRAETALRVDPADGSPWHSVKQLLAALDRQRIALADKEARLRQEEEQLETLKGSLRDQVEGLTAIRAQVAEALRNKWEADDEDLKRLARVYEATTPEQSGVVLSKLDAKLAAQILSRMNGPRAGKVLGHMEPTHAARISEQLLKKE